MLGRTLFPVVGAILLLLSGCISVEKRPSAKEYYGTANEAYAKGDFTGAVDNYRDLLDHYPLNPYAEEAQLKISYSYYIEKKYAESVAAFSDFERAYPTSMHLPFVEYYRGMSYLEQMRSIDRDQSVTEKAHERFRAVTDRFPESPFAPLAEKKIRICREALAAHELLVANYYDGYDNVLAARTRLRALIENYPETDSTPEALGRLEALLIEDEKPDLAKLAAQARAVRLATAPPQEDDVGNAPSVQSDLPAPGVDPLLTLVTELKKQEDDVRKRIRDAILADTTKMKEQAEQLKKADQEKADREGE